MVTIAFLITVFVAATIYFIWLTKYDKNRVL